MSVTFTTNIGLAKPDEAELAKNWAVGTELASDNNAIVIDKMDIGITAYTPVLAAQTTAPTLGTGTSLGEYCEVQGFIFGNFRIEFLDAGITSGSGEYGISLPVPVNGTYHIVGAAFNESIGLNSVIGEAYIWDSSTVNGSGGAALDVVTVGGVSYARIVLETFVGKTSRVFRNANPWTLATGDKFLGQFFYKRA